jgi:hypothetical protein
MLDFLKRLIPGPGVAAQSVILRRQVPVRFDEPVRSWLGGLPQMPAGMDWPRTKDGAPMHFLAQIACADLPPGMWSGRGPRDGWLLAFVDTYALMGGDGEDGAVSVLHIPALGPERQPPDDMGCVRHAMADYIGWTSPIRRPGVPKMWRRWPVDIVVQDVPAPNENGEWLPVPVAALYDGPAEKGYLGRLDGIDPRPLTWRGALYLVQGIAQELADPRRLIVLQDAPRPEPGWLAARIDEDAKNLAKHLENIAQYTDRMNAATTPEARAVWEGHISTQRAAAAVHQKNLTDLAAWTGPEAEAALAAEFRKTSAAYLHWQAAQADVLAGLEALILGQDLDALLAPADWAALHARLAAPGPVHWQRWNLWHLKVRRSLMDHASKWADFALREDVLDLYTRDEASRAAIPPEALTQLERRLRHVEPGDALHRMGGPRDPVQSLAEPGDGELLFQFGSDLAFGWMWGDVGALYVYLSAADLKAGRFARATGSLEGH